MPKPTESKTATLGDLLAKMAGDLATVEASKDTGLLALYSYAMELAQVCAGPEVPEALLITASAPRVWLDKLLDTTAAFDQPTIERLGKWQTWFTSALDAWVQERPLPALPADWNSSAATEAREIAPAPIPVEHTAVAALTADEPVLILNADAERDLLAEFINESAEHLQNIEQGVLVLEKNPADADTLNSIFPAFHTFKGGAGFLNLTAIKDLAHELESLLDAARQHRLEVSSGVINVILEGGDRLTEFVGHITKRIAGGESSRENVAHIARLGVRDYLVKPFKEDQLIEKLGRIIPLAAKAAA